jgi:hypothetical protein
LHPLSPLRVVRGWFVKLICYFLLLVKHIQFVKAF